MRDALKTLFHPFEAGFLPSSSTGHRVLFLAAEPGFGLPRDFSADIVAVQGFRPLYLGLEREGWAVFPHPEGDEYDCTLVLCGRHRGENELRIADAIKRTRQGGLIVVAGCKEDGVASLRKRLESGRDAQVALGGSVAKYHGVAFWLERTPQADGFAGAVRQWHGSRPLVDGRFRTAPGMFSSDRIDAGSRLLAEHLPADLSGRVADFCAGWGYLAWEVRARCPAVASIDLYEADFASLEAARANLAGPAGSMMGFHWRDLVAEPVAETFDAIVMNPPFHAGRAAEPALGQSLIASAASSLRRGGRLLMVANRGLPYAESLRRHFASVATHAEEDRAFRVYEAVR
jgi:16S rRNA (guanine1207-N2)-methyltransferase